MLAQLQDMETVIASGNRPAIEKILKQLEKICKKYSGYEPLVVRANALKTLGRRREAAETFVSAAEKGGPIAGQLWLRAGMLYQDCQELHSAKAAYQHALQCLPDSRDARNNLAVALYQTSQATSALPHARWLMEHSPHAEHYITANYVFRATGLLDQALEACKKALRTAPDNWTVVAACMQAFQHAADWKGVEQLAQKYAAAYAKNEFASAKEMSLVNITWCMDECINFEVARHAAQDTLKPSTKIFDHTKRLTNAKTRIGYVSADLRNHAILHLTAGIFEQHDKEHYEIFVYSHSPNDGSPYRKRLLEALGDHHIDTRTMNDAELAQRIKDDNIDILVDLMGLTEKNRLSMFQMRPAPVLCTWLGFPGTTGYDFLDYAITDAIVTPDASKPYYTEKLCRLPETYQSNDFMRTVANNPVTRADCRLPENTVVLASFNQTSKIDSETYAAWMRILRSVPETVLWILDPGAQARTFIEEHTRKNGVAPERLIYADRVPPPLHLARLSLADIVVDTRVYNGHTTTSDALWAGVPVFTVPGTHFASRVSASLLHACGLTECIAADWEDFHHKVCKAATNHEERTKLRHKLACNRFIKPLYDTERFTRHLEKACDMMLARYTQGLPPDHFDVPALEPRIVPFCTALNARPVVQQAKSTPELGDADQPVWQLTHAICPLCSHEDSHRLCKQEWILEEETESSNYWHICKTCDHVFTHRYWTPEGRDATLRQFPPAEITAGNAPFAERERAGNIIRAAQTFMKPGAGLRKTANWADIYPVDGWLPLTALEYGFKMTVVTEHEAHHTQFAQWLKNTVTADFLTLNIRGQVDVVSLRGTLERVNFPTLYLERAATILKDDGLLLLTFANAASVAWRVAEQTAPHAEWNNPFRLHFYSLDRLNTLLKDRNMEIVHYEILSGNCADSLIIARKVK